MSIDIPKDARTRAIALIQRYFEAHEEPFGYWQKYDQQRKQR